MQGWGEELTIFSLQSLSAPHPLLHQGLVGMAAITDGPPRPAAAFASHTSTRDVPGSELTSIRVFNVPRWVLYKHFYGVTGGIK